MMGQFASAVVLLVLINVYCGQATRDMPASMSRSDLHAPISRPDMRNHWNQGRCAMDEACDACADDEKEEVWTTGGMMGSWMRWLRPARNQTRTVCCQGCRGKLATKQGDRTYSCMCHSEKDTCGRNSECDKCDPMYVTKVMGQKYCCQGCQSASVSFDHWGMNRMGMCSCNEPMKSAQSNSTETSTAPTTKSGDDSSPESETTPSRSRPGRMPVMRRQHVSLRDAMSMRNAEE